MNFGDVRRGEVKMGILRICDDCGKFILPGQVDGSKTNESRFFIKDAEELSGISEGHL